MTRMLTRFAVPALLALGLLGGCSRDPAPTPPAEENYEEPQPVEPAPPPPPVIETTPAPPPPVATENLAEPVEPPVDPSDQTLEDADATGLTTRATPSDEEDVAPAGNEE
jgi:hypothetical protein